MVEGHGIESQGPKLIIVMVRFLRVCFGLETDWIYFTLTVLRWFYTIRISLLK